MRVVYSRVSTEEQAKTGYSVEEQLHTLREHASSGRLEVVAEVADEGYSGADPDRPGLLRVMELAESGEIDAVVAVKRDRLFRSRLYRREFYRDVGLKVLSDRDRSLRLTLLVDLDMGAIRWETEGTSTR